MKKEICSDCDSPSLGRRRFLVNTAAIAVATPWASRLAIASTSSQSKVESIVAEFFGSLSESQRSEICRPYSDSSRETVNPNWHVAKPLIGSDFYTKSQQTQIDAIVRGLTSQDGYTLLQKQMDDDDGGQGAYSVAVFGNPNDGSYQWMLTGRHLTLRADGNSQPQTAFGGAIVYGHGEESSPEANLFYYQTKKVNEVFQSLSQGQAKVALLNEAPQETDVRIRSKDEKLAGIAVADMNASQQKLVQESLQTILGPYRSEDGEEALQLIAASGGIDQLRFAFYQQEDLGNDRIWDVWRIEGPSTVIHFRGAPHVHAYIHVRANT